MRGYRIEPSEIQYGLNRHPEVEASHVVAIEDTLEKRLVAYLVPPFWSPAQLPASPRVSWKAFA